jgi:uncharacterized protein (DUF2147 family)
MKKYILFSFLVICTFQSFSQNWVASATPQMGIAISNQHRPVPKKNKKVEYKFEVTNTMTNEVYTCVVSEGRPFYPVKVMFPGFESNGFRGTDGDLAEVPDNGGTYTMKCLVDGKVIVSGKFVIPVADMEFRY